MQAEPSAAEALAKASFDVVSLADHGVARNHCTDCGAEHTCPRFHKPDGGDWT